MKRKETIECIRIKDSVYNVTGKPIILALAITTIEGSEITIFNSKEFDSFKVGDDIIIEVNNQ